MPFPRPAGLHLRFRALVPSMSAQPTFASFFQGGFESSSHRRRDGVRLDLIRATSHDKHVLGDYRQCAELGLRTIRDGLRWHLIEKSPGKYDWSSWMPALEAAERAGVEIIWDLFHYGSPDCIDQAAPDFPERFTEFAVAALEVQQSGSNRPPLICPLNEINFLSWAVDDGYFPRVGPNQRGWFKDQLVRNHLGMGDQAALAEFHDHLGRALDSHRPTRSPPTDGARRRAEPAGDVRGR